jgi:hypothetical protein
MEREHALNRGAAGLEGEMIDKPMILQVSIDFDFLLVLKSSFAGRKGSPDSKGS